MRFLPLFALLLSATAASSSIRPISFTHGATGGLAVLHGYYNPNFGQGYTSFSLNFESPGYPPQPADVHVVPTLPDLPGAHWLLSTDPFASYKLEVPVWSTPPADNGNWESFAMELHATLSVNAFTPGGAGVNVRFEFETTELMECSISGLYFLNPEFGVPMQPPLDTEGRLFPGHHILSSFGSPGFSSGSSGTLAGTLSLILGPVPVDTDQDGLSDYDEIITYHTDPNKTDTDGDGIDDKEEIRTHHTQPTNPDSDGDGFTDSFEISSGKSPLDPLSAPAASLTIHRAVELRVITKLGTHYRIQSSADLQIWKDTETLIEGNGSEIKRLFEAVEGGARYWRVREVD